MIKKNNLITLVLLNSLCTMRIYAEVNANMQVFKEAWTRTSYLSESETRVYCIGTQSNKSFYLKTYSVQVQNGIAISNLKPLTSWTECKSQNEMGANYRLCGDKYENNTVWVETSNSIVNRMIVGHPKAIVKTFVHSNSLVCNGM